MHITRSHNFKWTLAITAAALAIMFSRSIGGAVAAGLSAPIQAAPLEAVRPAEQAQASDIAMVIRELAVIGVVVLGTVFVAHGRIASARALLVGFPSRPGRGSGRRGARGARRRLAPARAVPRRDPDFDHFRTPD